MRKNLENLLRASDTESPEQYAKRLVPQLRTERHAIARMCFECSLGEFTAHCNKCPLSKFAPKNISTGDELKKFLKASKTRNDAE